MKFNRILTVILILLPLLSWAQPTQGHLCAENYCSFSGLPLQNIKGIHNFSSETEARAVMNEIVQVMGLHPNFIIQAANVPNAAAWINESRRYILYNPSFIQSVRASARTDWAAISILAHEIGHHLNGHTLSMEGSRPKTELEADEFSGYALRKMGATLEESQIAMRMLASPNGTSTHPARDQRLKAIERGWARADMQLNAAAQRPTTTTTTTTSTTTSQPPGPVVQSPARPPADRPVTPTSNGPMPAFAQWRVVMTTSPHSEFFITKTNAFVVVRNDKPQKLGDLQATSDRQYPYVIKFGDEGQIMIAANGDLVSPSGKNLGYIIKKM
jgi:hypothetical protein